MSVKIGTDGAVVYTESPLVQGWDTVTNMDTLLANAEQPLPDAVKGGLKWTGSKLPAALLKQVLGTIHEFPSKETGFVLLYRISDNSWRIHCPNQSGSGGAVSFADDREDGARDGYAEVGTIHTHPEMSAFWSGTDMADQKGKRGIHIVFGLRGGLVSQHLCTIFSTDAHYDIPLWDVCEEVPLDTVFEPVAEWTETIAKQAYKPPITASKWTSWQPGTTYKPTYDYAYDDDLLGSYSGVKRSGAGLPPRRKKPAPLPSYLVSDASADESPACAQSVRALLSELFTADPEYAVTLINEVVAEAGLYDIGMVSERMDDREVLDQMTPFMEKLTAAAEEKKAFQEDLDDMMAEFGYVRNLDPTSVMDARLIVGGI